MTCIKNEFIFESKKTISFSQLLKNLNKNVFRINYNNILAHKETIEAICILTKSKVICWDYVNMTAKLEKLNAN